MSLKLDLAKMGVEVCRMECRGNYAEVWKLRFLRVCREFEGTSFPKKTNNYLFNR